MGVFLHCTHYHSFSMWIKPFLTARFGTRPPFSDSCWGVEGHGTCTFPADKMRMSFYRKVVLSVSAASPRLPGSSYGTAMLILDRDFDAPAFATAEDAAWRLASLCDGVEDAIHHDDQFHSVSYSGVVEAWRRDAESDAYTSMAVTPRLIIEEGPGNPQKYLAAAPGGRLMVVLKYASEERYNRDTWTYSFKVHALWEDMQWKETRDIDNVALFVGVTDSLCVPTRGRSEIELGCVYSINDDELGDTMVFSLKDGTVEKMEALDHQQQTYGRFSPRPVWIMPSIP